MAHLVPEEIFKGGFESRPIKTEEGKELGGHTYEDVEFALRLLAFNNSRYVATSSQLETDYHISVHSSTLKRWASSYFVQRYIQIQHELANEINKKLSGKMIDIADKAVEVQEKALNKLVEDFDKTDEDGERVLGLHSMPGIVDKLSKAASTNLEKSQLLRDRPTEIVKHDSPDDALEYLRKLGLLKEEPKQVENIQDAEVVE